MPMQTRDVRVKVENAQTTIYVTDETADAIRADANRQADEWLREAVGLWDECDVTDLEQLKEIAVKLALASDAIDALRNLAPIPEDESAP